MRMTIDELKVLLALNGNKRIAHTEDIIFSDDALTLAYIQILYADIDPAETVYELELGWAILSYTAVKLKDDIPPTSSAKDAVLTIWPQLSLYIDRHPGQSWCRLFKTGFYKNAIK